MENEMKEKLKEYAKKVYAAVKSAPAVFAYGIVAGYVLGKIV